MALTDVVGGHGWAEGCEYCRYGIALPHANETTVPLYLATMFAVRQHLIAFCTCRAGRMAQAHNARVQADYEAGKEHIPPQWLTQMDAALVEGAPVPTVTHYRNLQPVEVQP